MGHSYPISSKRRNKEAAKHSAGEKRLVIKK